MATGGENGKAVLRLGVLLATLLAAGALTAFAYGETPKPDPAPKPTATVKTTPAKTTPTTTTAARTSPVTTTHASTPRTTSRRAASSSTTAHTTKTTRPAAKPKPAVVVKAKPRVTVAKPKPKPRAQPKPKSTHSATGAVSQPDGSLGSSGGSAGTLARTLLLTLAILFLTLAAVPWRSVLRYHVEADQVLRWRVAFGVVSLSVGLGYVLTSYLNGAA